MKLFHYTSRETALEQILPTRRLRFGRLPRTNDPREFGPLWPSTGGYVGPGAPLIAGDPFELIARADQLLRDLIHVLCFTTDQPSQVPSGCYGTGPRRARMWAQYSDNHAGICLCFNEAQLISEAEKQLGPAPGKRLKHQLVSYASEAEYPPGPALLEPEAGQDLRAFIVSMLDCKSDLFFTKDWDPASETEYRFLLWGETQDNEEIDIQDSLEAVIAGPRFHPVYRPGLYKLCHELGVEALQIEWRRGHPPAIVRMPDPSSQSLKL